MVKKLLSLFFPRRCVVCDCIADRFDAPVCSNCAGKIRYIKEPFCMKCGKQLEIEETEYCSDCSRAAHLYRQGTALYDYGSMADSIFRFKYSGRTEYAVFYGWDLYRNKRSFLEAVRPDALVPVPIHSSRMRSRGYNQAQLIARELSRLSGIPMDTGLICRKEKTQALKDLNPAERQNNLKRAFKICRNDVKLSTIVIVDDIYTTGSTIDAMTEVLHKAGIPNIYFMALTIGRGM